MELSSYYGLAALPIITALLEMVKRTVPELPERFYPLAALVLGIVWNVAVGRQLSTDLTMAIIMGIVTGLASSGLYSQSKTYLGG